jgi:uncharacterized protein YjbI with pentapeptide repeats
LSDTCLANANLLLYDSTKPAKHNAPNLSNGTDPTDVDLTGDHLVFTNLDGANLKNADVSGAFLTGALVTDEQLESCASLRGATLPDGRKHD